MSFFVSHRDLDLRFGPRACVPSIRHSYKQTADAACFSDAPLARLRRFPRPDRGIQPFRGRSTPTIPDSDITGPSRRFSRNEQTAMLTGSRARGVFASRGFEFAGKESIRSGKRTHRSVRCMSVSPLYAIPVEPCTGDFCAGHGVLDSALPRRLYACDSEEGREGGRDSAFRVFSLDFSTFGLLDVSESCYTQPR
jgi:hypothetical protein